LEVDGMLRLAQLIEEKVEESDDQILVHCRIQSPIETECG